MVREASSAVPQSCSKIPQQLQIRADVRCEQQMRLLSQAGPAPDGALNALRAALRKATPAKAMAWPFRDAAVQGILRFFASQEQAVVQDGLRVVLHHLEALASRSKKILPPTETCAMCPSRAAQAVPGPRVLLVLCLTLVRSGLAACCCRTAATSASASAGFCEKTRLPAPSVCVGCVVVPGDHLHRLQDVDEDLVADWRPHKAPEGLRGGSPQDSLELCQVASLFPLSQNAEQPWCVAEAPCPALKRRRSLTFIFSPSWSAWVSSSAVDAASSASRCRHAKESSCSVTKPSDFTRAKWLAPTRGRPTKKCQFNCCRSHTRRWIRCQPLRILLLRRWPAGVGGGGTSYRHW